MLTQRIPFTFSNAKDRTIKRTCVTFDNAGTIKRYTLSFKAAVHLQSGSGSRFLKKVKAVINAGDTKKETFKIFRNFDKKVTLSSRVNKKITRKITDFVNASDEYRRVFYLGIPLRLKLAEKNADVFNANRTFKSHININSKVTKVINKKVASKVNLFTAVILPVTDGVVSDIGLMRVPTNEGKFTKHLSKACAWGFSPWQEFNVGESYFREMLVRLKINNVAPELANDIRIMYHKVICDVEDVTDTQTVSISAKETYIEFNKIKKFRIIPEVIISSYVTQTFAVPQVIEVYNDGFKIKLVKPDGKLESGRITYVAHGY